MVSFTICWAELCFSQSVRADALSGEVTPTPDLIFTLFHLF
jgi:hypothetical protein